MILKSFTQGIIRNFTNKKVSQASWESQDAPTDYG